MHGLRDQYGRPLIGLAAEVREMDRRTIEDYGLPGRVLMELAGAGTARLVLDRAGPAVRTAVVLCGGGNNGGDGYVIARHLADADLDVRCISISEPSGLSGDAAANLALWDALDGRVFVARPEPSVDMARWIAEADVVVDALFGTGLSRPVEGPAAELIALANRAEGLKVAVDLPSGVEADTGAELGEAFRADLTATFGVGKLGLHQQPGAALAGEVHVVGIAMPRHVVMAVGAGARLLDERAASRLVPRRPVDGHKGTFGHVGVVGGFSGKEGAAILASLGALRAGAGLLTWNTPATSQGIARPPELMQHTLDEAAPTLDPRSDVLVVGPGLGRDDAAYRALAVALDSGRRLILDADAVNFLADDAPPVPSGSVLTPHPAEAARVLGCKTSDVQADRPEAARALASRYDSVAVLKGAGTLIAAPGQPLVIVETGDPTLSTGGTGDVLAGVIGALVGQGLEPHDAAALAVYVHGRAGERVGADRGRRGALASEVAEAVPRVLGQLLRAWGDGR